MAHNLPSVSGADSTVAYHIYVLKLSLYLCSKTEKSERYIFIFTLLRVK